MSVVYVLELTEDEAATIARVGGRYGWSDALSEYGEGAHMIAEGDAREIIEGIESDMEGGHDAFPMLDFGTRVGSDLADKLVDLYQHFNE